MFKSPKMLTDRSPSPQRGENGTRALSMHTAPIIEPPQRRGGITINHGTGNLSIRSDSSPTNHHVSRRQVLDWEIEEVLKPGRPQFETATWLYQMTLARNLRANEDDSPASEEPSTRNDDRTISLKHLASANPEPSSLKKLPSPQRLSETSVLTVARRAVGNWTFLEPIEVLLDEADNDEGDLTGDSRAEDDDTGDVSSTASSRESSVESDDDHSTDDDDEDDQWDLIDNHEIQPSSSGPVRRPPPQVTVNNYSSEEYTTDSSGSSRHRKARRLRQRRSAPKSPLPLGHAITVNNPFYSHNTPIDIPQVTSLRSEFAHPPPSPPPPPPPPKIAPQSPHASNDETMLNKLETLLLGHQNEQAKQEAKAQKAAENAKFDRLEAILISQQEARCAKEKAKQKAAAELAAKKSELRKKDEEDTLARLERLMISQRQEQLEREAAAEAARKAEAGAADLMALRVSKEKEAADALIDAANQARKESEKKAAEEAEKVRKAHERALSEAQRAVRDLEDMIEEERRLREKAETVEDERSAIEKVRLAATKLVDNVYGKEEKKWYMTANGPACIDTSDGCFARQILSKAQQEEVHAKEDETIVFRPDATSLDLESQEDGASEIANHPESTDIVHSPAKYHVIFPAGTKQTALQDNDMLTSLQREGIESLFELDTLQLRKIVRDTALDPRREQSDIFIPSSLLWQRLPAHGQSELYQSLCKSGWKPTYLRSSGK
jgi:hypothetical protein